MNSKWLISFRGIYPPAKRILTSSWLITTLIESPSTTLTTVACIIPAGPAAERGRVISAAKAMSAESLTTLKPGELRPAVIAQIVRTFFLRSFGIPGGWVGVSALRMSH